MRFGSEIVLLEHHVVVPVSPVYFVKTVACFKVLGLITFPIHDLEDVVASVSLRDREGGSRWLDRPRRVVSPDRTRRRITETRGGLALMRLL